MDERSLPADERESAYELLQRGQSLMRKRHHAQAAIVLERAARAEPGKGSILEALGRAYFNSAQPERAGETFERLLEVDPSSPYGHFALGQSLKRLGRNREARTHLRMAVALDPASTLYRGALERLGPAPSPGQRSIGNPAAEPPAVKPSAGSPAVEPEPPAVKPPAGLPGRQPGPLRGRAEEDLEDDPGEGPGPGA